MKKKYYMIDCLDKRMPDGKTNWKVTENELSAFIVILQHEKCTITGVTLLKEDK